MKKSPVKFIYFDIGGVFVDHLNAVRNIAKRLDIPEAKTIDSFKEYADKMDRGTMTWSEFDPIFYEVTKPKRKLENLFHEVLIREIQTIQESHDLVNELAENYRIGILSNIAVDVYDIFVERNMIPSINYNAIVKSASLGLIKPEREIFEHAQSLISEPRENVLFVDDTELNIQTARDFGWQTVQFDTKNPEKSVEEIRSLLG